MSARRSSRAKKKTARRKPAKKTARAGAKRAPRGAAKKPSARKPARGGTRAKRGAKPTRPAKSKPRAKALPRAKQTSRPALTLVKHPAPRPAAAAKPKKGARSPKPFEGALATASAKDLVLFDLVRARVELHAAVQGMLPAWGETPIAEGKWNPRQIVLHLHYWDREMLPWVERAFHHDQRPPHTRDDILAENEAAQVELASNDWESARRLMQQSREALVEALQSLPEEPAERWSNEHSLGWLVRLLAHHDRHHAAKLKEARGGSNAGA